MKQLLTIVILFSCFAGEAQDSQDFISVKKLKSLYDKDNGTVNELLTVWGWTFIHDTIVDWGHTTTYSINNSDGNEYGFIYIRYNGSIAADKNNKLVIVSTGSDYVGVRFYSLPVFSNVIKSLIAGGYKRLSTKNIDGGIETAYGNTSIVFFTSSEIVDGENIYGVRIASIGEYAALHKNKP